MDLIQTASARSSSSKDKMKDITKSKRNEKKQTQSQASQKLPEESRDYTDVEERER